MDQTCSMCSFFVGVDPSFNGTAVVVLDENANIAEQLLFQSVGESIEEKLWSINKALSFIPKIIFDSPLSIPQRITNPSSVPPYTYLPSFDKQIVLILVLFDAIVLF